MSMAYFAGGCFWCISPVFRDLPGVLSVRSGYSGGTEENPVYDDVKHQRTGHRETIRVEFDGTAVSFPALLEVFLSHTDPFDGEGQFIDRGHSYTLAVYYTDEMQKRQTEAALRHLEEKSARRSFVSIEPFTAFYDAEEYHQDYDLKHPAEFEQELIDSGRKK